MLFPPARRVAAHRLVIMDPSSARVVAASLFDALVDLQVSQSQRLRYPVSLICMAPEPPLDADALTSAAARVCASIRATDVVSVLSGNVIAVLLVDAETFSLPTIFHRITQQLPPSTSWRGGGGCYPMTAAGAKELMEQAAGLMRRAQAEREAALCLP